jgi:transcriptional regulator with XRE-family HTH domain
VNVFRGDLLQACRERAGLTSAQVATATGLGYPTIRKFETDIIRPSADSLARLGHALRCRVSEFFGPAEQPDNRDTELGPEVDAWMKQTLATAPRMTDEQKRRVSILMFGQRAS